MKKQTMFLSILSLVLILASLTMIGITYGWFSSVITFPIGQIGVGELKFTETGAFVDDAIILLPGEELVDTDFTLTNESPITSQLRMIITYTKITNVNDEIIIVQSAFLGDGNDHIQVNMNSLFERTGDYWYYGGYSNVLSANSGYMDIISSLAYNGAFTGIDYSNNTVHVSVNIQVKQAEHVTWEDLVNYDFNLGYPSN